MLAAVVLLPGCSKVIYFAFGWADAAHVAVVVPMCHKDSTIDSVRVLDTSTDPGTVVWSDVGVNSDAVLLDVAELGVDDDARLLVLVKTVSGVHWSDHFRLDELPRRGSARVNDEVVLMSEARSAIQEWC